MLGRQIAHRKWRVLVDEPAEAPEPEAFFIDRDGKPAPHFKEAEHVFAKQGLMRGSLDLRGMSQPPDPQNLPNLIFTLRALLGVNARAEIMAWLLTHESGHPAAIARSTGYFSKSIQQILNEMAESGLVASIRIGREKHFSVPRREKWQVLLCPATGDAAAFPEWVDWMPLFSVVTHFSEILGRPGIDETSEHFQAAKLRDALYRCTPALAQAGRAHSMDATLGLRGTVLVNALMTDLERLLD